MWWRIAVVEIKRCYPKLPDLVIGAKSNQRTFGEAIRRVKVPFLAMWMFFKGNDTQLTADNFALAEASPKKSPGLEFWFRMTQTPTVSPIGGGPLPADTEKVPSQAGPTKKKPRGQAQRKQYKHSYLQLATVVLRKRRHPMTAEEIWIEAQHLKLLCNATGKTPIQSLLRNQWDALRP
jgi:hypothetical protein